MRNNWKKYKLNEILVSKNQGVNTTTEKVNYSETGIPVIRAKNISELGLDMVDVVFVDFQTYSRIRKECKPKKNDILYTNIGSQMGNAVVVKHDNEFTIAWNVLRMVCNVDMVNNHFLMYILNENVNKEYIRNLNTSSTMPFVSGSVIGNLEFTLPPLTEQTAIAEILSALDDKIELNLQTNKTIEEMANAPYKHWFVDFGPFQNDKFIESELGMIPEGWEVKELKEVAEIVMGQSPESKYYNENEEGLPFHQGVTDYGIRFPTNRIYSTEGKRFAQEGDILFSVRAPVGKINIAKHKIILGRGLAAIRDISNNNNFLFSSLRNQFETLDSIGSGTVYNSVNKSDMEKIKILTPTDKIKQSFNNIIKDLDTQYFNNDSENITLKQTRDYLLPKLISGEIRVKEAAQKVKQLL